MGAKWFFLAKWNGDTRRQNASPLISEMIKGLAD
jgi:hypothetical protein